MGPSSTDSDTNAAFRVILVILAIIFIIGLFLVFGIFFFYPVYQSYESNSLSRSVLTATSALYLQFLAASPLSVLTTDSNGQIISGPLLSSLGSSSTPVSNSTILSIANSALSRLFVPTTVVGSDGNNNKINLAYGTGNQPNTLIQTDNAGNAQLASCSMNALTVSTAAQFNTLTTGGVANLNQLNVVNDAQLNTLTTSSNSNLNQLNVATTATVQGLITAHVGITSMGMIRHQGSVNIVGNIQALGGIQTPILNANFLSTDANGNLQASTIAFPNSSTSSISITQNFVPNVLGNFNVTGTTQTGFLRLIAYQNMQFDYATIMLDGTLVGMTGSNSATPNAIVKYDSTGSFTVSTLTATTKTIIGSGGLVSSGPIVAPSATIAGNTMPTTICAVGQIVIATTNGQLTCSTTVYPLNIGSAGQALVTDGQGNAAWQSTMQVQYITTSGSWTMPTNAKIGFVSIWGGGGGGGGGAIPSTGSPSGGGGGGGGAYIANLSPPLTAGMTCVFTIGSPGTAGAINTAGGNGGATTVQCDLDPMFTVQGGTGGSCCSSSSQNPGGTGGSFSSSSSSTVISYRVRAGGNGGSGGSLAASPGSGTAGSNSLSSGGAGGAGGSMTYQNNPPTTFAGGGGGGGSFFGAGDPGGAYTHVNVVNVKGGCGGGGGSVAVSGTTGNTVAVAGDAGSSGGAYIQYFV